MSKPEIVLKDYAATALQAAILAIPVVGPSLEKLMFGVVPELRMKRVEATLNEVGERLGRIEDSVAIEGNADFAVILEAVIPPLARSRGENKRQRFRDLLVNAATVPPGAPEWDGIEVVAQVIDELDQASLEVFSLLHNTPVPKAKDAHFLSRIIRDDHLDATIGVYCDNPKDGDLYGPKIDDPFNYSGDDTWFRYGDMEGNSYRIPLDKAIVFEAVRRLSEKRLICIRREGPMFSIVTVTPLGELLARWAMEAP